MAQQNETDISKHQELFIDFVASGQLTFEGKKQTYEEFGEKIGVNRSTLYRWQKDIPDFWNIVAVRAGELIDHRIPRIMNAMYAKALRGDVSAAKLLLGQAGRLNPPNSSDSRVPNPEFDGFHIGALINKAVGVPIISPGRDEF